MVLARENPLFSVKLPPTLTLPYRFAADETLRLFIAVVPEFILVVREEEPILRLAVFVSVVNKLISPEDAF